LCLHHFFSSVDVSLLRELRGKKDAKERMEQINSTVTESKDEVIETLSTKIKDEAQRGREQASENDAKRGQEFHLTTNKLGEISDAIVDLKAQNLAMSAKLGTIEKQQKRRELAGSIPTGRTVLFPEGNETLPPPPRGSAVSLSSGDTDNTDPTNTIEYKRLQLECKDVKERYHSVVMKDTREERVMTSQPAKTAMPQRGSTAFNTAIQRCVAGRIKAEREKSYRLDP
jgi:hypothetical protein